MTLVRRHFSAISAAFAAARQALLRTNPTSAAVLIFDQCVVGVADQLALAAGTFDKVRFLEAAGVLADHRAPALPTHKEQSHD